MNGGRQSGINVYNHLLTIEGAGNTTLLKPNSNGSNNPGLAGPLAPLVVLANNTITGTFDDCSRRPHAARPGSASTGPPAIDTQAGTRLNVLGSIDDGSNLLGTSDLIKVGAGELGLLGANTYRGTTYVFTSATANPGNINGFFGPPRPAAS